MQTFNLVLPILSLLLESKPDPETGVGASRGDSLALVRAEVLERILLPKKAGGFVVDLQVVSSLPGVLNQVIR